MFEASSGGWEEQPYARGQGRPGEATSRPRPGAVTLRSHPEPEARAGGCVGSGGPRGAIPC